MNHDFDSAAAGLPEFRPSAAAQEQHLRLIAELIAGRVPLRNPRRRWALTLAAVLGLSGIGVGTAAGFGFFSAAPADRRIAHCYSTADLDNPANQFDVAVATAADGSNPSLRDAASSAMEICRAAWVQGQLDTDDPAIRPNPRPAPWNYPVPSLIACVLPSGEVGIFPGQAATCDRLGLAIAVT